MRVLGLGLTCCCADSRIDTTGFMPVEHQLLPILCRSNLIPHRRKADGVTRVLRSCRLKLILHRRKARWCHCGYCVPLG